MKVKVRKHKFTGVERDSKGRYRIVNGTIYGEGRLGASGIMKMFEEHGGVSVLENTSELVSVDTSEITDGVTITEYAITEYEGGVV